MKKNYKVLFKLSRAIVTPHYKMAIPVSALLRLKFFEKIQGCSVTILIRTRTGLYGFKTLVQNNVFASFNTQLFRQFTGLFTKEHAIKKSF